MKNISDAGALMPGQSVYSAYEPHISDSVGEGNRRRLRFFRREARAAMRGNLLPLIFSVMFFMLIATAVRSVCSAVFIVIDEAVYSNLRLVKSGLYTFFEYYLGDIMTVLCCVPLFCGLYCYVSSICGKFPKNDTNAWIFGDEAGISSRKPSFSDIFEPFSHSTPLLYSYNVFLAYFWRWTIPAVLLLGGVYGARFAFSYALSFGSITYAYVALAAVSVGCCAVVIAVMIYLTRYYMALHLAYEYRFVSLRRALKCSARIMRGHKCECIRLQLGFTGWLLLSLVTLGVAAVVYVIPYMLVTNAVYASYLLDINRPFADSFMTEYIKDDAVFDAEDSAAFGSAEDQNISTER